MVIWFLFIKILKKTYLDYYQNVAYPSTHPIIKDVNSPFEIDQLFDSVESSKATAILRMMEYEVGENEFKLALIVFHIFISEMKA